jgi:hypothetical protein
MLVRVDSSAIKSLTETYSVLMYFLNLNKASNKKLIKRIDIILAHVEK